MSALHSRDGRVGNECGADHGFGIREPIKGENQQGGCWLMKDPGTGNRRQAVVLQQGLQTPLGESRGVARPGEVGLSLHRCCC